MFDRRAKNAMIFRDTEMMYRTNETLKEAVENSIANQRLILAGDVIEYAVFHIERETANYIAFKEAMRVLL